MVLLSYKVFFLASLPFWSLAFTGFTTLSEGTREEESNLSRGMKKKKEWIGKAKEDGLDQEAMPMLLIYQ